MEFFREIKAHVRDIPQTRIRFTFFLDGSSNLLCGFMLVFLGRGAVRQFQDNCTASGGDSKVFKLSHKASKEAAQVFFRDWLLNWENSGNSQRI